MRLRLPSTYYALKAIVQYSENLFDCSEGWETWKSADLEHLLDRARAALSKTDRTRAKLMTRKKGQR